MELGLGKHIPLLLCSNLSNNLIDRIVAIAPICWQLVYTPKFLFDETKELPTRRDFLHQRLLSMSLDASFNTEYRPKNSNPSYVIYAEKLDSSTKSWTVIDWPADVNPQDCASKLVFVQPNSTQRN